MNKNFGNILGYTRRNLNYFISNHLVFSNWFDVFAVLFLYWILEMSSQVSIPKGRFIYAWTIIPHRNTYLFSTRKSIEKVIYFMLLERKERSPTREDKAVASIHSVKEFCKSLF